MDKRIIVIRNDLRRQRALNAIRDIKIDPDHLIEVVVQDFNCTRSLAQNRLMWFWYKHIRLHMLAVKGEWYSEKSLHRYFSDMFMPWVTETVFGKVINRQKTSSELNVKEFSEYLTNLERYCYDNENIQLVLPRPEDMYHMAMGRAA